MLKQFYGVALRETPHDRGLTQTDAADLISMLHGLEGIPIEIQAENSTAMGFINMTDAEFMNYDYKLLTEFVQEILNDMNKETPDCSYEMELPGVGTIDIWISRN